VVAMLTLHMSIFYWNDGAVTSNPKHIGLQKYDNKML
jgi:hypothetical protein